jgi:hypothetical protein
MYTHRRPRATVVAQGTGGGAGSADHATLTGMSATTPQPVHHPGAGRAPRRTTTRLTGLLTAVLHLAVLWPYAASGLLAPGWAVGGLLLLWAVLAVVAVGIHRRWGAVSALVPLLAIGLWFAVLTLGERLLGWTG